MLLSDFFMGSPYTSSTSASVINSQASRPPTFDSPRTNSTSPASSVVLEQAADTHNKTTSAIFIVMVLTSIFDLFSAETWGEVYIASPSWSRAVPGLCFLQPAGKWRVLPSVYTSTRVGRARG